MQAAANALQNVRPLLNRSQASAHIPLKRMGLVETEVKSEYKGRGDGSKMKALAWFGKDDVRVIEAPIPDITQARSLAGRVDFAH